MPGTLRPAPPLLPGAAPARSTEQRRIDVLRRLGHDRHLWIASAAGGPAHLIPLAFVWYGDEILMATKAGSRTARNLCEVGQARVAVGDSRDVVLIDGPVELTAPGQLDAGQTAAFGTLPIDPTVVPGMVCIRLRPRRIQAWRGPHEIDDRLVMRAGRWLA